MTQKISSDTQTTVHFVAGDEIQLDAGVTIDASGIGISGPEDASGATMTLLGSVKGSTAVEAKSGGHTITIGPDATISGNGGGVLLDTGPDPVGNNIVKNAGLITTTSSIGDAIRVDSSNNEVTNTGTITGAYGISVGSTDINYLPVTSNNTIINSGTIDAVNSAILVAGDGSLLNNSGTIKGLFPVKLFGTGLGTITVKNTGMIEATSQFALQGSTGADLIDNSGVIIGSLYLDDGNDLYDGRMGRVDSGSVELEGGDDIAYGGLLADLLDGGAGNDTLEGGLDNDILNGGEGIDTAVFSGPDDAEVDLNQGLQTTGYGNDTLLSIENLVGGSGNDIFTGNEVDNALTGGEGNDTLNGGSGSDTAVYTGTIAAHVDLRLAENPQETGHGQDTLISIENLAGGEAGDTFIGDGNANTLTGNAGDDTLDGGLGDDVLNGGSGSDTALFNGPSAAIVNLALTGQQNTGYGLDTLAGIENLTGGAGADAFTGDGNANKLVGDGGNDFLDGGFGNDILDGGARIDTVVFSGLTGATVDLAGAQAFGYGVDTLIGIENAIGGAGSDNLIGSSAANWLAGGSGSDLLNGGLGNDTLDGGSGLDVLRFTGSTGAVVNLTLKSSQNTGYGRDVILNFEGLWGGVGADRFTGSSGNNAFIGEAGRDTISGGSGHDTLAGGTGSDRLTGGTGKDVFVFDTKLSGTSNLDTITDFRRVDDTIRLENAIFKKLTKAGPLNKNYLAFGAKAKDKNDYLVYDKAKGALYYDADGSGKGAAVKFAQLVKNTALDYKDFIII